MKDREEEIEEIACIPRSAHGGSVVAIRHSLVAKDATSLNEDAPMEFQTLVERARGEFLEMPGLRLTAPQAARLWGLEREKCDRVIAALGAIVVPALDPRRQRHPRRPQRL